MTLSFSVSPNLPPPTSFPGNRGRTRSLGHVLHGIVLLVLDFGCCCCNLLVLGLVRCSWVVAEAWGIVHNP